MQNGVTPPLDTIACPEMTAAFYVASSASLVTKLSYIEGSLLATFMELDVTKATQKYPHERELQESQ